MKHLAAVLSVLLACLPVLADGWKNDPVWHDGLVEKARYSASREIYGQRRRYEAVFFTNKEQHDRRTLTKAEQSQDMIEVWKHNQVEVIPTANYDYKFVTTTHLAVDSLELTRLDCSSQEFCGTSFKQYLLQADNGTIDYWSFSYMPEEGRMQGRVDMPSEHPIVAEDALPVYLRDFDFDSKQPATVLLLPSQKQNHATPYSPRLAVIHYAGEEDGAHKLELRAAADAGGKLIGTYWIAGDRLHVMTRYRSADGKRSYDLVQVERVNYWSRDARPPQPSN